VYESQISPELEGIKLKIKKSPTQEMLHQSTSTAASGAKKRPKTVRLKTPRARKPTATTAGGKGRKRKRRKKGQSDEGTDEEVEEDQNDFLDLNGSLGMNTSDNNGAQSIWANERMPPEILSKIFMEVTYTEGCVPTLVR
jgi:hypothetical protein